MLLDAAWDRACESCRRYVYTAAGVVMKRAGVPVPRDERTNPPPCADCPKVPDGVREARREAGSAVTPSDAIDPEAMHRRVVEHYLECRAVGRFPADRWVRRHAAIVRPVEDVAAQVKQTDLLGAAVARALGVKPAGR